MGKIAAFFRDFSFASFFIPVGVLAMVFSIFVFNAVDHAKGFKKTEAVVTKVELSEAEYTDENGSRVDATYDVYIKYTVDGKEYQDFFNTASEYDKGDKVEISYNPKDPSEIAQPTSIVLPIAILAGGAVSLIAGIISVIRTAKKRKALKLQEQEWSHE